MASYNIQDLELPINTSSLPSDQKSLYGSFVRDIYRRPLTNTQLLEAIPSSGHSTSVPLACLSSILTSRSGPWPIFELIRCYQRLWRLLPENLKENGSAITESVLGQVKNSYRALTDLFIHNSARPALIDPHTSTTLNHSDLSRFIDNFHLPIRRQTAEKPLVVVTLPNGSLLGLTCLAVATYYTAVPVNSTSGAEQFRIDVQQSKAKVILALRADVARLGLEAPWIAEDGIEVFLVDQRLDLTFDVSAFNSSGTVTSTVVAPNGPDDIAFILFTSGTSGTKKMVPITVHSIVSGCAFVAESWGLTEADSCLNQMPLNHVGGLVRNLFAPILVGGSTICCTAFDANLFWDVVEELNPTWYYASPTMHSAILDVAADRSEALAKCRMRLVCNAAGGLLPSLAVRLSEAFHCTVLPSYGMTECMPISTPPLDYALDRPGTSGISCGPEMAILDGNDEYAPVGEVGKICVRGSPLFPGYLTTNGIDTSPFKKGGWFDTGDMGYTDNDGYLYVTGRSKEVINRGGELISPFEVEEAIMTEARKPGSPIFGRVSEILAFSANHNVLQEVVGVVLVTPADRPRVDLRQLQSAVKLSLHQTKWPVTIVYMTGLPKNNNKILRINMGDRLSMDLITDETPMAALHFEAECPPPNTALTVKIPKRNCFIDCEPVVREIQRLTDHAFDIYVCPGATDGLPDVVLAPQYGIPSTAISTDQLQLGLQISLHGYLVPSSIKSLDVPFPQAEDGSIDEKALASLLQPQANTAVDEFGSPTERKIRKIFATILGLSPGNVTAESDFFEIGGDSLKAGKLLSSLRKDFQVRLPIGELFTNSTVRALCAIVDKNAPTGERKEPIPVHELPGCTETYGSTNPLLLLLQLIPIGILYPMKRALEWTILLYMLSVTIVIWGEHSTIWERFLNLLVSIIVARLVTSTVPPLVAIAIKWIVIGRYKEGMYPMWGPYHTRWWFVEKALTVGGKGIFKSTNFTRVLYYRLLGAKIGEGVSIDNGTILGEYDLLEIHDRAVLDRCLCRPFAVERNTSMYLGRITIGRNSSVGLKATIAAGSILPPNTCIGPNSSSWEMKDATEANRDLSPSKIAHPHILLQWLVAQPLLLTFRFFALFPWMAGLIGLVIQEPAISNDMLRSVLLWLASPKRVGFHFLARILGVLFGPVVYLTLVIATKRTLDAIFGKLQPGPAVTRSTFDRFRQYLYRALLQGSDLSHITECFGSHYEVASFLVRLLGAKVGKRVYWPGSGPSIQDYDFIDIGDDVVFGSRAHIVTSDGNGTDYVRIGNGAMVADRVVLLPGSSLGSHTVFGSGALARRNTHYPADTVWVGSQRGSAICLTAGQPGRRVSDQSSEKTLVQKRSAPSFNSDLESGQQSPWGKKGSVSSSTTELQWGRSGYTTYAPSFVEGDFDTIPLHDAKNLSPLALEKRLTAINEKEVSTTTMVEPSSPTEKSSTPFGRAFYEGKAPYHVLGLWTITFYCTLTTVLVSVYWNVPTIAAVQAAAKIIEHHYYLVAERFWWRPLAIYFFMTLFVALIMTLQAVVATALVIGAKWLLMGRRKQGGYDWDRSSYCQRWQILLTIERFRRSCYGVNGIVGMLTGTHYAVLYMRALGATIGRDCALFAGGKPSLLFTEPDLLTLGDRVAVDDASLVAHINSRGNFNLNPLVVGDRSVLRSGSRLLSGAQMGADTCLLEHTLVMAGDVVDEGTTQQGWPAEAFAERRVGDVERGMRRERETEAKIAQLQARLEGRRAERERREKERR